MPGEKLAQLGERMSREEVQPGATIGEQGRFSVVLTGMLRGPGGLLRPGDSFDGTATAVTPATVAGCPRADYEALIAD